MNALASVPVFDSEDGTYSATYSSHLAGKLHRRQERDVIVYLISGGARLTADENGAALDVVAGEAIFLPRGSGALWEFHEDSRELVVTRAGEHCEEAQRCAPIRRAPSTADPDVRRA